MRQNGKNVEEPERTPMTIRGMRIAWWIHTAAKTHSKYVIVLFHCNKGCKNAPQCYVIRTLPVFILSPCMLLHSLFITNTCTY